jgi:hypothetical protein
MNLDIAAFTGAGVQFGGPVLIANDGTLQLSSVLVSPASGTNYYVVYVKQNESTSPGTDASNLPVRGVVLSTTSFAVARATLPTGAVELATVQVPSGVVTTNAGGVTITQTFQYTAAEGGVVYLRDSTQETGWSPADGSVAYRIDLAAFRYRIGGQWRASKTFSLLSEWHVNVAAGSAGGAALGPSGSALAIAAVPYARAIRVTVMGGVFPSSNGDGGVSVVPSTGSWAGATNVHRILANAGTYFNDLSYVFYMTSLAASTALTLTLTSQSSVTCGYDLHFIVEEL